MGSSRFFLSQDQSSHWYIVPVDKRDEWSAWLEIPENDEASWNVPEWATPVGGSPGLVTFECWAIGD